MRQTVATPRTYPVGSRLKQNRQLDNQQPKVKMNLLINSLYYFLHKVFIISNGSDYRLIVIKDNQMLTDKTYPTLRGAKISFARIYSSHACRQNVIPAWSSTYSPQDGWLNSELSCQSKCYH